MICKLTQCEFQFASNLRVGVHPEAFCLPSGRLIRTLEKLIADDRKPEEGHVFYLRLAMLLYLDERLGLRFGSVVYQPQPENYEFDSSEVRGEIVRALSLFKEMVPDVRKFKLKSMPCKGTVEFLEGCFYTYQEGMNYTPLKQYLQTTLLSEAAINAICDYSNRPNAQNFMRMEFAMMGQHDYLLLSDKESDFYSNRKLLRIKKKLDEVALDLTKLEDIDYEHVPTENNISETGVCSTRFALKKDTT